MVELCALASGSNGNCYYIGNEDYGVLVDGGISFRQLKMRMQSKGLDVNKIVGLFITHEHSDHCRGVCNIQKKLNIPVYVTRKTYNALVRKKIEFVPEFFNIGDFIELFGIGVFSFSKTHDASDPCSYVIEIEDKKVGVFTDIGYACENVKKGVADCDFIFLESNYDVDMLENGSYPLFLKKRVQSNQGHLSNMQAFELVHKYCSEKLRNIVLSHISADNNTVELAEDAFAELQKNGVLISASNRECAGELLII
jgi:phosphoribosyl 1,2-cyclic phosphodiesterase